MDANQLALFTLTKSRQLHEIGQMKPKHCKIYVFHLNSRQITQIRQEIIDEIKSHHQISVAEKNLIDAAEVKALDFKKLIIKVMELNFSGNFY